MKLLVTVIDKRRQQESRVKMLLSLEKLTSKGQLCLTLWGHTNWGEPVASCILERIENEMRWAMKKYQKLYLDKPLPHITPHVFRYTFCTNMANAEKQKKSG